MNAGKIAIWMMLLVALSTIPTDAQNEKSISVGGHTFAAELPDGWILGDDLAVEQLNFDTSIDGFGIALGSSIDDNEVADVVMSWKGYLLDRWLIFPEYPNAPKSDALYHSTTSKVSVCIATIPKALKDQQLEHDIRVYGSADKIPDDQKSKDINEILSTATGDYNRVSDMSISEKDITFNDHPAHLIEADGSAYSFGKIAVLIDNDTVGVIDVSVNTEPSLKDATQATLTLIP